MVINILIFVIHWPSSDSETTWGKKQPETVLVYITWWMYWKSNGMSTDIYWHSEWLLIIKAISRDGKLYSQIKEKTFLISKISRKKRNYLNVCNHPLTSRFWIWMAIQFCSFKSKAKHQYIHMYVVGSCIELNTKKVAAAHGLFTFTTQPIKLIFM